MIVCECVLYGCVRGVSLWTCTVDVHYACSEHVQWWSTSTMVVHVVYWCSVPPVGLGWIRVVELLECAQHRCATACHIRAVSVGDLKWVHALGESGIAVLGTSRRSAQGIVLVSYCRGMVAGSYQP